MNTFKSKFQLVFIIIFFGVVGPIWWFVIPNLYKKEGLYTELERGDVTAVEKRIDSHEEVITRRFYGLNATPLHIAAGLGDIEMMEMLLRKGANIEVKGYRNLCEPIHLAAGKGHIEAVEFLLKNGAYIDAKDRDNETPLHDAAYNNQAEMIDYLVKHGANINAKSSCYHLTPLEKAVKFERATAVRALLENGAKADLDDLISRVQRDMAGAPLADEARKKEWIDVLEILREFKKSNAQPASSQDAKKLRL
jgi:ankyrin repeat protein